MDWTHLFLQRYNVLHDFYLEGIWETVSEELMRQRPHARVNSIAWNLWHLTRVEDAGLNRFVVDRPQVFDEGAWSQQLNLPWRHHGTGMTFAEVDELNRRIDLAALRAYSRAVRERTRALLPHIRLEALTAVLSQERVQTIVVDEGLAHSEAAALVQNYTGWDKGRCLMTFCLTHSYQHVGEMDVLASLLGVVF